MSPTPLKVLVDEKRAGRIYEKVAAELGVHETTLKDWIAGQNKPNPENQKRLAAWLGVTVAELDAILSVEPAWRAQRRSEIGRDFEIDELRARVVALEAELRAVVDRWRQEYFALGDAVVRLAARVAVVEGTFERSPHE